ncbi:MAG TPA: VTT domain-containing protein [Burkholderiaceae bacterium]|jgi:uncharacterized membrane protein YdjX (TVP38/TMEM64 family)|nr:VTT domain-containing protein [Burkholderiaceae bacterium]
MTTESGTRWRSRRDVKAAAIIATAVAALLAATYFAWSHQSELEQVQRWIEQHSLLGAVAYVLLGAASVVLLPFSSLPLLPLATRIWGVLLAGLLSAAGWWLGCLIAFWLARLGRRWLERLVSLEAVDRLERKIPRDVGFGGIVILRMIFPVDVISFALGLLRELRFSTYAVASLIGILPFSFVWSYAGGELGTGRLLSFAVIALVIVALSLGARRLWLRCAGERA